MGRASSSTLRPLPEPIRATVFDREIKTKIAWHSICVRLQNSVIKISAYVPCYNASATISRPVESLSNQSVSPDELFVIDDGSFERPRLPEGVRVLRFDRNQGRGAVRARAMAEAKHELVVACDATLVLDPNFIEQALPWFAESNVAAVFGWVKEGNARPHVNRWRERHLFQSRMAREIVRYASLATGCSVIRKSLAEQVGGFDALRRWGEDADLGQRLLSEGFDVVFDPRLFATAVENDSIRTVIERYVRWNTSEPMRVWDYLRQIGYALRVMVRKDLQANDPIGACISLLTPHCQFWYSMKSRAR
jgi:glycosyltransferase involved in cell wall biosynthesis